jgi:hypothetical protein
MKTKKPNTLQQRLGFLDDDLKKPKHDDMLLWFDRNAETILDGLFSKPLTDEDYSELLKNAINKRDDVIEDRKKTIADLESQISYSKESKFPFSHSSETMAQMQQQIETERKKIDYLEQWKAFAELVPRPKVSINSKTWELPVTTHSNDPNSRSSKYTVGFIDMAVSFFVYHPVVTGFVDEREKEKWVGDLKDRVKIGFRHQQVTVYVEAKTEIGSLGELIRQIRHYKEYLPGEYYVLCPDEKHASTLQGQRIGFIKYEENLNR